MFQKPYTLRFPVWQFLNQPLNSNLTLNPRRYWNRYSIELLERCLSRDCASQDSRCD
ncbi:hypothetical protein [Pantanalinema sp. GBBB05]|uniref:hypothetical protein n=1 Tax=Pantanalinema sp. GBBB05 TaxID=2604139 RepID=UPI003D81C3B7